MDARDTSAFTRVFDALSAGMTEREFPICGSGVLPAAGALAATYLRCEDIAIEDMATEDMATEDIATEDMAIEDMAIDG